MPKEKFMDRLRTYGMSIKVPLTGLVIAVAILPLFLQAAVMLDPLTRDSWMQGP